MEQYNINLQRLEGPHVHFTRDIEKFNRVYNQAISEIEPRLFLTLINGEVCLTKEELLNQFSLKLQFPNYFSNNWDSFDECMNDLEWLECDFFVIFIKNFEFLLSRELEKMEDFLDIILSSISDWQMGNNYESEPMPFHVIIHSNKEIPKKLNDNLNEIEINRF